MKLLLTVPAPSKAPETVPRNSGMPSGRAHSQVSDMWNSARNVQKKVMYCCIAWTIVSEI
jgi:hypothetical protein